jgi:hypothetical protein
MTIKQILALKYDDLRWLRAVEKARLGPLEPGESAACTCLACDAHVAARAVKILQGKQP